jgi:hypothetical protein
MLRDTQHKAASYPMHLETFTLWLAGNTTQTHLPKRKAQANENQQNMGTKKRGQSDRSPTPMMGAKLVGLRAFHPAQMRVCSNVQGFRPCTAHPLAPC